MSAPPARKFRITKPRIQETISMLRSLPRDSLLVYLMATAALLQSEGKLSEVQRARVAHLARSMLKEIDKAA